VAERDDPPVGVVLWTTEGDTTELTYLWALEPGTGVGTALVDGMLRRVRPPIWLVTTNDNVDALRFYQRKGFRLLALRPGAGDTARALKPTIPAASDGIPIRDELELVLDESPEPGRRDA
jgi:hypothetical protein